MIRRNSFKRLTVLVVLIVSLCPALTLANAQSQSQPPFQSPSQSPSPSKKPIVGPNAERGLALAEQLCRGCHIVSPKQTSSAGAGIPSFRAIANKPEQTSAHIANVLIKPHAPMPNMQLSRFEILDIIAYLDGLRRPDAGAPLLKPGKGGVKPKYPRRS